MPKKEKTPKELLDSDGFPCLTKEDLRRLTLAKLEKSREKALKENADLRRENAKLTNQISMYISRDEVAKADMDIIAHNNKLSELSAALAEISEEISAKYKITFNDYTNDPRTGRLRKKPKKE